MKGPFKKFQLDYIYKEQVKMYIRYNLLGPIVAIDEDSAKKQYEMRLKNFYQFLKQYDLELNDGEDI